MRRPGFPSATNYQYIRTELSAGDALVRHDSGELKQGQVLTEGAVVGKIRTGADKGKFVLSLSAATDGSEKPYGVLAFDVDATEDDTACEVRIAGDTNEAALVIGTGHTLETVKAAFEGTPHFLRTVRGAAEIGGVASNALP